MDRVTMSSDANGCMSVTLPDGSQKQLAVSPDSFHEEVQAAVLDVKLKYLDQDLALRKQVANRYINEISNPLVVLPKVEDWDAHAFHIFPVLCERRDDLQKYLTEKGIQTIIHYPIPPHKQECYKEWNDLSFPITEQIHRQELSIPMSPVMKDGEVDIVIEALNKFR